MKLSSSPPIDTRQAAELLAGLLRQRGGYVPEWQPADGDIALALLQIAARYGQTILQRLNQAPEKNKLAFLDLFGIRLITAQAARTPVVFQLAANATDLRVPAGARLAAPPPPGSNDQTIFETEVSTGVAVARLQEVVSLWPGRDQYIDHSQAFQSGQPFQLFKKSQLVDMPHALYLAHERLLNLSGEAKVDVNVNLATPGSERLDVLWEYWDGNVWREFLYMRPECDDEQAARLDTTDGLIRNGVYRLLADCAQSQATTVNSVKGRWIRARLLEPLPPDPTQVLPEADKLTLSVSVQRPLILKDTATDKVTNILALRAVASDPAFNAILAADQDNIAVTDGFAPDAAVGDGITINLTQPFFPFGPSPQPGSTFYFSSEDAFSRPGASVVIFIKRTLAPSDELFPSNAAAGGGAAADGGKFKLAHTVRWEYWNGQDWQSLLSFTNDPTNTSSADPKDFNLTGLITFTVPDDWEKTTVNNQDGHWMRARLVSGSYGFTQYIPLANSTNSFAVVVAQPPVLSEFCMGYAWTDGPYAPECVFTYNDFQYEDHTEDAKWEGRTFRPFTPPRETTPAMYLGFDQKLPVDRLGIYVDMLEDRNDTLGPALVWEFWNGYDWLSVPVEDETRNLRVPGMLSLIGPDDAQPQARFDVSLFWLRARLKEDGPPGEPLINALYPNAVWAAQIQTVVDQPIGASTGLPNQVFQFIQFPVLEGEQVEVRELAGMRANVEWRSLAMEVFGGEARKLQEAETLLQRDGPQTEIQLGDLRLKRDRAKRVTEAWVRWHSQPTLLLSGPNDRDYTVERAHGRLIFGDGQDGKVPPSGAAILARKYRSGGGLSGNIGARKLNQMLAPIGGVGEIFNPIPATGGADSERPDAVLERGPLTLRRRGRSLSVQDYETMAREASASVSYARALACRNPAGITLPGWVTLVIIPQGGEARPYPSFGLREAVRKYIEGQAAACLVGAAQIYVTGPDYRPVDVQATLAPRLFSEAGAVEQRARQALETFLHPLLGGSDGHGWEPGRSVYRSDVSAVLERVEGVDFVSDLALLIDGALQGDSVPVNPDQTVVAGQIVLKLIEGEAG